MGKAGQTQAPRKISCFPCRQKKVKCDGQLPCLRCVQKETRCVYTKPAPVGRPPKNAVVNKLVLLRPGPHTAYVSSAFCKEFIFENIGYGKLLAQGSPSSYLYNDKSTGISVYVREIFKQYFGPSNQAAQTISNSLPSSESKKIVSMVKLYDLLQQFSWTTCDIVNIVVRRFSRLTLQNYVEPAFTRHGLVLDRTDEFFDGFEKPKVNPLNSLPPQQATRLIECFFSIHPYCHLFSKTLLLQSYWTDTADPFLMSVIYGTTAFFSQLFEGKPVSLWETSVSSSTRNAFLDYAYHLLDKANAEITLSRYQAVVLLSLFEVQYGYAKRGMSLFALSYMLAGRLGIRGGKQERSQKHDDVEEDLLRMTFWASYNATVRGCIELDQVPREVIGRVYVPLPPATVAASASYQFDMANNNYRLYKSFNYMFETFFIESVIAHFSSLLFLFFPESDDNLFRIRKSALDTRFLEGFQTIAAPDINIEGALKMTLLQFKAYIDRNKHEWTPLQVYTIESTYLLYEIHFSFLKAYVTTAKLKHDHLQGEVPIATRADRYMHEPLDMDDIDVILRLYQAAPLASLIVERMMSFLDNPKSYSHHVNWLPHSLMASCLETGAHILILKYHRDPWDVQAWHDLKTIQAITGYDIWFGWSDIQTIRDMVAEFFTIYPTVPEVELSLAMSSQLELVPLTSSVQIYNHGLATTPGSSSSSEEDSTSMNILDSILNQPLPDLFENDLAWLDELLI
ncbi:hypothetical protein BX666DRAFT_2023620 [Dichotomocladium elegans]|nr:hypothetical protein BX666DRAFT_2023620 [Dichotomocladium elegans]